MDQDKVIEEFKERLHIDKLDLDSALADQADIFYQVCEMHALAVSERDSAYDNVKQVDAELYVEIRKELEEVGEKPTEKRVEAMVLDDERHREAVSAHLDAKLKADKFSGLKESFHQRNYMLRGMTDLFATGYFTTESGGRGPRAAKADEAQYNRNREKLKERRKERASLREKRTEDA